MQPWLVKYNKANKAFKKKFTLWLSGNDVKVKLANQER